MKNYAIILAAGIGSRLYPLTQEYPKSLVKVNGREILDYQIQGYIKSGIDEENIYIVTGYKHDMIANYLKNHYPKVNEIFSTDYLSTNNMYSLYLGLKQVHKMSNGDLDYLFINNADCLYDEKLMNEFVNSNFDNAIFVIPVLDLNTKIFFSVVSDSFSNNFNVKNKFSFFTGFKRYW